METINLEELRTKLDKGDDFRLVMTMDVRDFNRGHIPGSLSIRPDEVTEKLRLEDEIVVYCSEPACICNQTAYRLLRTAGCVKVRRFSGGLEEWSVAGYPLETS